MGIHIQARSTEAVICIGDKCHFNNGVSITSNVSVRIGNGVLVGGGVSITDCDWHPIDPQRRTSGSGQSAPVSICDNVWLGSRVQVLKGVTIGEGAIVAAGAVVVSDVPPYTIAGGVPARVIREIQCSKVS